MKNYQTEYLFKEGGLKKDGLKWSSLDSKITMNERTPHVPYFE